MTTQACHSSLLCCGIQFNSCIVYQWEWYGNDGISNLSNML